MKLDVLKLTKEIVQPADDRAVMGISSETSSSSLTRGNVRLIKVNDRISVFGCEGIYSFYSCLFNYRQITPADEGEIKGIIFQSPHEATAVDLMTEHVLKASPLVLDDNVILGVNFARDGRHVIKFCGEIITGDSILGGDCQLYISRNSVDKTPEYHIIHPSISHQALVITRNGFEIRWNPVLQGKRKESLKAVSPQTVFYAYREITKTAFVSCLGKSAFVD